MILEGVSFLEETWNFNKPYKNTQNTSLSKLACINVLFVGGAAVILDCVWGFAMLLWEIVMIWACTLGWRCEI